MGQSAAEAGGGEVSGDVPDRVEHEVEAPQVSGARQTREDAPAAVIGREAVATLLDEHLRDGDVARGHAAQQRRLAREVARVDEAEILVAARLLD